MTARDFLNDAEPTAAVIDAACAEMDKAVARIEHLIQRVDVLHGVIREKIAADDAMMAFLLVADPKALGEGEWDRLHKVSAARRYAADEAMRAAIAKAA